MRRAKQTSTTVHTARTIMLAELSKVMDFSVEHDNYQESMKNNVFGKKSQDGVKKTSNFLKQLYGFDLASPKFKTFKFFWLECDEEEKKQLTLVYALSNDYLLKESCSAIGAIKIGEKVRTEAIMEQIEKYHPKRFTEKTLRSVAQNIASSWKQAGFIQGKVKNIRVQPEVSFRVVAFAMMLSYLNGDRGDFIINNDCVQALFLSDSKLRDLAVEASKRDYLQYQFAGNVTSLSFDTLFRKIGINAI